MSASLQCGVGRMTSACLQRGQLLATAIDASFPRARSGPPLVCLAAMALALGFSTPVEAGSTLIVNTTADPNLDGAKLSLRQAIAVANWSDGNTVQFDPSLAGSTITLTQGELAINRTMVIAGLGVGKTTISGNDASRIFSASCSAPVDIKDMRLTHGKGALGGAIAAMNCTLNLTDVDVTDSLATFAGGGVYADDSTVSIIASSITGNSAPAGGGVSGYRSVIGIGYSTISGNAATYAGGGIYVSHASKVYLDNSTVSGNSVPVITGPYSRLVGGGGALALESSFIARESTIVYNYAFSGGGGIRLYGVFPAKILSSTVVGNSTCCYDAGNGLLVNDGSATFAEAIVANNFNRGGYDDIAGTFLVDRSLVRSPGSASITGTDSLFGVDPKLGKLGVNGGPTLTMLPAADSPAVDAEVDCSNAAPTDQRGVSRCVNGHLDWGAVERQIPEVIIFRNGFNPGG